MAVERRKASTKKRAGSTNKKRSPTPKPSTRKKQSKPAASNVVAASGRRSSTTMPGVPPPTPLITTHHYAPFLRGRSTTTRTPRDCSGAEKQARGKGNEIAQGTGVDVQVLPLVMTGLSKHCAATLPAAVPLHFRGCCARHGAAQVGVRPHLARGSSHSLQVL